MTPEEGNKLIAEFDGRFSVPNYHSSWDWLMPVVEKIGKCNYNIQIHYDINGVKVFISLIGENYKTHSKGFAKSPIEAIWLAVVEFIKIKKNKP